MISLAPLRYRLVSHAAGGPIARLELAELPVNGERRFQANAFLRPDLVRWQVGGTVFSSAAGSGVDRSPLVARYKAISEAIERWALMAASTSAERQRYGFDVDPSSNGMAAFPGWRARQARAAAMAEAVERFHLLSWWEGRLAACERPSPYPGIDAAVLCSELPGVTVLLHRVDDNGWAAYGHAGGATYAEACAHALEELERYAVAVRLALPVSVGALPSTAHPIERRSVFFATSEGHELFLAHLRRGATRPYRAPRLLFDGALPGPWSRYADVWRVALEPPSDRFLSNDVQYFYW